MGQIFTRSSAQGKGHLTVIGKDNKVSCFNVNMHAEARTTPDLEASRRLQDYQDQIRKRNDQILPDWNKRLG